MASKQVVIQFARNTDMVDTAQTNLATLFIIVVNHRRSRLTRAREDAEVARYRTRNDEAEAAGTHAAALAAAEVEL